MAYELGVAQVNDKARAGDWWIGGGICVLPGDARHTIGQVELELRGGVIAAIHPAGTSRPADLPPFDARGRLVLPGAVNAHIHSPDTLIRGSAPELPLELWSLHSAAGRVDRSVEEVGLAIRLTAAELLRAGVTSVVDHIRFDPAMTPELLSATARAWEATGMRVVIAPVLADRPVAETLPFDDSDFAPEGRPASGYGRAVALPWCEQIALVDAFAREWHGVEGRISVAVGPSGPQRCTDALLEAAGELSARCNLVLHSHVLETRVQRAMAHRLYGCGMIAHLEALGLLSPRANLVHAIWLDDGDLDRIAASGAGVVHNPVSNAKLGSGLCAVPEMLARGIPVALGTDSACCNDGGDLFETAKWAALLHNFGERDPARWVGPYRAFDMATRIGAKVAGLGAQTGAIAPGYAADLSFVDLADPVFAPLIDPVRQMILSGGRARVDTVMVAGRTLLRDGRCETIDLPETLREAREAAARRLKANTGVYAAASALAEPIRRMYARLLREEQQ